jgi:RNA polymerase sigma factor (sigma-70 family)
VRLPPFQHLLDRHGPEVHRFLVAAVGRQEADDCYQETMLAALRAYPRLRDASNLRGWLLTVARRKAIDEHRGRGRRAAPAGTLPDRAAPVTDAEDPAVWEAVRALPSKQRAAVLYRFVCDLPHREIARLLGCTEAAARRSLHAGLTKLREGWR